MNDQNRKARNSQGRVALLLCMFALMLVSAIDLGLMFMSDVETNINSNYRSSQQAYYAARAGLEEMRDRMRYGVANGITAPTTMPSSSSTAGVIYILNADGSGTAVQPWNASNKYFDDELCHESFSGLGLTATTRDIPCSTAVSGTYYTSTTSTDPNTGTNASVPYKWIRLTLKQVGSTSPYCVDGTCTSANLSKQVCWDPIAAREVMLPSGVSICEAANPQLRSVYVLTSLATTSTGSRRMTQVEVTTTMLPPMPAALTFDGSNPTYAAPNSNPMIVDGTDHGTCAAKGAGVPAMGAYTNEAANQIDSGIKPQRADNYIGVDGTIPDIANVGPTGSNAIASLATVGGLQTLVSNITSTADQIIYGTPTTLVDLGSTTSPKITVITGDFDMGNAKAGAGILLVEGCLSFNGNPGFNGMVLVIGKGCANFSGGGNGAFNGAVLVANLYDSTGHLLSSTSAPGAPVMDFSGGGNFTFTYDSCLLDNLNGHLVYHIIASREEIY